MMPAMLATSVGMYCHYNTFSENKTSDSWNETRENPRQKMKLAHKMISKLPMEIKNLNDFSWYELQAITRRNTIKNKLVGRNPISKESQNSDKNELMKQNINYKAAETLPKKMKVRWFDEAIYTQDIDSEWDEEEAEWGKTSSIISTSSVTTSSSESCVDENPTIN